MSTEQAKNYKEIASIANEFLDNISYGGDWDVCVYEASAEFRQVINHLGVCKTGTGEMVAMCGDADAKNREQTEFDIAFISKAPTIIRSLLPLIEENERLKEALRDLVYTAKKLWDDTPKPIMSGGGIYVSHPIIENAECVLSALSESKEADNGN